MNELIEKLESLKRRIHNIVADENGLEQVFHKVCRARENWVDAKYNAP